MNYPINKKYLFGFAFYDFANSSYILIFHAFLFPIFFKEIIFKSSQNADFWWGLVLSLSVALAIIFGPMAGHRSDVGSRKKFLSFAIAFTLLGIITLGFLYQIPPWCYFILFLLTNLFFILSQIIYDSYLPHIASKNDASLASGFSWGFGYLGGIICLTLVMGIRKGSTEPSAEGIFLTGAFYMAFSLVALMLLPSLKHSTPIVSFGDAVRAAKVTKLLKPLLAIWLINEAIDVMIFFGSLYARGTLSISIKEIGIFLIIIQIIAFPATWLFGLAGKRYGVLRAIYVSIAIWFFVILGITIAQKAIHLAIVAIPAALVIGSTQALLRAFYSQLSSSEHAGLNFGFYSLAARSSAVVGPLLFGALSALTQNPRIAMLSTIIPLLTGVYILRSYGSGLPENSGESG